MINTGERAYAYAKACGIIGKSFVGRRVNSLKPLSRLSELDRLVFGTGARELPERELLPDLERRFSRRSVASVITLVNSFKNPPLLLTQLLRVYEYADLKTALTLINETSAKPEWVPLGRFGTVHFEAWPDAKAMLSGTDLEFLYEQNFEPNGISLETALDRHYYGKLWKDLRKLKKTDRITAEKICAEEIILRNCAWVLRLRTYYGMNAEEVKRHLVIIEDEPQLTKDALAALEFSLDHPEDWAKWKQLRFLNPAASIGVWRANPRYFQNSASGYLYRLALVNFRKRPFSIDTVFCFIKLKQFEEDVLTSNAEGLGMGLSGQDVLSMLEASS